MSNSLPIEYKVRDALHWFMQERARNTERENQEPFSEEASYLLVEALKQLLEGRELSVYAAFEHENRAWIFVVCGDAAHRVEPLLDRERPSKVEVEYLGPLNGGKHSERLSLVPEAGDPHVAIRFEHARLPGGAIEFDLEPVTPNARRSPSLVERSEQLGLLRPILQEWSFQQL